jgi:hypothetical protein
LDFCNQTCFSNRPTKAKAKQLTPEEKQKEYCKKGTVYRTLDDVESDISRSVQ